MNLKIIGETELIEGLLRQTGFQPKRPDEVPAGAVSFTPPEEVKEAEGYALDYESLKSVTLWLSENKDLILLAGGLIQIAVEMWRSPDPKSSTSAPKERKVTIRSPLGDERTISILPDDTDQTIARKIEEILPAEKK